MRIFVYGMQSSGASLFTFLLAQKSKTVAVIDFHSPYLTPEVDVIDVPEDHNLVLKAVVTPKWSFEEHVENFKPDKKILFVRNIDDNIKSLSSKFYRDVIGTLEEKVSILEQYLAKPDLFDAIVYYEDLLYKKTKVINQLDGLIDNQCFLFQKSKIDVIEYAKKNSKWCRDNFRIMWSFGNIHLDKGLIMKDTIKLL